MAFNSKLLTLVEHAFVKADFRKEQHKVYFFGNNARGVLMGIGDKVPEELENDDIPF